MIDADLTMHVGDLLLRPVDPQDYDALLAIWNDPGVRRVHGLPTTPLDRRVVESWYQHLPPRTVAWVIEQEGEVIGTIELVAQGGGCAELGVVLSSASHRSRGLGRRICRQVAKWGFTVGGFEAIELAVREQNWPAIRAFLAAGFVDSGLITVGVRRMRFCDQGEASVPTENFKQGAHALRAQLVEWRRHLHRHPELAFQERATVEYLDGELRAMGYAPYRLAGGLVVDLDGDRPGERIALRADMDGLPIAEETGLSFASETPSTMHACGHDAHMAILLGAAHLLWEHRHALQGHVRFMFQPAEERPPGGAIALVEAGALRDVSGVVGLHVEARLPVGKAQLNRGPQMANADIFRVTIQGTGGHGSEPHRTVDAVLLAAHTVDHLQTVVSRRVDPQWPVVVSVGSIHAGSAPNIIADRAELTGTVRTFTSEAREKVQSEIRRVIEGLATLEGGTATLDYEEGYPAVVNPDHGITAVVAEEIERILGAGEVIEGSPDMGGEDFAYYQKAVPGVFWFLGCGGPDAPPHHSPRFLVNEDCLPLGAAALAASAFRLAAAGVPAAAGK